jgi:hypothetical protein
MADREQVAAFNMDVKPLDWLIRSMAGDGLMSKPWIRRTLRRLLRALSNPGVIQSFYIRGQDTVASRITRELGLSGTILDAA